MKASLLTIALLTAQLNSLQDRPVVHLPPHVSSIRAWDGGALVELINAPAQVSLPTVPPKPDIQNGPWTVDIRNLGPALVTIIWSTKLSVPVNVGRTIHIVSNGSVFTVKY